LNIHGKNPFAFSMNSPGEVIGAVNLDCQGMSLSNIP
jgi:hypothetical protein